MDKIGRFEIIGKLGRGAFGMVYKGRDPVINRLAAIKVMSEATVGDPELVSRFRREAEAAGGLQHRNIVTIYDLGEHGGLPYIAMEYLEGKDLERLLKEKTEIPVERKIEIVAQVAEGLHYAHGKGIVHRDIKPANIRLLEDGTVKIMDFGIAKMTASDMTRTGQFMGTVNYMSPEQIKAKRIDGRSDLFAVGVVFYELISFRRPFPGDSITAVIYKIVNENPPPLAELAGTPHEWLESVVFKCLEKDVNKRWGSCLELAEALRYRQKVAVDVSESPIEATVSQARQKAESGDFESAIRQLDEVLEHDPDNATVQRQRRWVHSLRAVRASEALVSQGRIEQARDDLKRALGENAESEEITRALEAIEGRLRSAESERALERGVRYLQEKRYEAALEQLKQAQQLDPYNELVKDTLTRASDEKRRADVTDLLAEAKTNVDRGQLDEARACVMRAMEIDPASRDARAALQFVDRERDLSARRSGIADAVHQAGQAIKGEDYDQALRVLERALALDPKNAELQRMVASARAEKAKADEKRSVLEITAQGKSLLAEKKFDQALLRFQKALKIDPAWREAQLGVQAAEARVASIDALGRKPMPRAALVGAAAALVLVVVVGGFLLLRPSPALRELRAADAALAAGSLSDAARLYLSASEKSGKDAERAKAKEQYAGLYQLLKDKDELIAAAGVLDQVAKWNGPETVRDKYRDLATSLGKSGSERGKVDLLRAASASWQEYFRPGYDKTRDYDSVREVYRLGEKVLERADEPKTPIDDRVQLYALAQELFTFVDAREVSLNAFGKANEARATRADVAEKKGRVDAFNSGVEVLLKRAQEAEKDAATYSQALDSYRELGKLVAQNQDLAEHVELERFAEMSRGGVKALEERLTQAAAAASQADRVTLLLEQAQAAERSGSLAAALAGYEELLKSDPGNAGARQRVGDLQSRIARLDGLKRELRAALEARDLTAGEARLKEALALASADTELAGFEADLGRLKKGAEEAGRVAEDLRTADQLVASGDLDGAEAQYKKVAAASSDRAILERTNSAIQAIRLKRVEAQIQPQVEAAKAAEASGDLKGALVAWRGIERLNASYPGLKEKLAELNRALNKERIAGLEKALEAAYGARAANPAGLDKALRELEGADASNPTLTRIRGELASARAGRDAQLKSASDALARRDPDGAVRALGGLDSGDAEVKSLNEQANALRAGLAALRGAESALAAGNLAEARRSGEGARNVAALAPDAERLLREVTSRERALTATPPPVAVTPTPAPVAVKPPPPPVDIAGLVAAGQWVEAARALDAAGGAQGVDPALAGQVYFNASYVAACKSEPCDFDNAKRWALAAGSHDDSASGTRLSNPRWAKTFAGFTKCDLQLRTLCGAAKPK